MTLSPPLPVLFTELNCASLEKPTNGWKSTETNFVDTIVQFGCYLGYKLEGSTSVKCLVNQTWSGKTPTCEGTCG